jgi:hypothetical protein
MVYIYIRYSMHRCYTGWGMGVGVGETRMTIEIKNIVFESSEKILPEVSTLLRNTTNNIIIITIISEVCCRPRTKERIE